MNNLAIISARGGSKRIPGKNIRPFLGKPIIGYAIEAAQKSGLFSEIMVSTDEESIAQVAVDYGAKVPFLRSKENADDYAPLVNVVDEVVTKYRKMDHHFDNHCCILASSPLITPDLLKDAMVTLQEQNFNTVWPVVKYAYPVQKALKILNNKVEMFFPDLFMNRTQDFEAVYHDAGMFYFMKDNKNLMDNHRGAIIIDEIYTQDIDNESDWLLAEMKFKLIHNLQ